jgi:hypothetical protein
MVIAAMAGWPTASEVEALTVPSDAVTLVEPTPALVAKPPVLMIATCADEEVQVTVDVTSCVLSSVYVPIAVNCWVVPSGIVGDCGLIAIETRAAGVTVRVAGGAFTPPALMPIMVEPVASVLANPIVPAASLMVATPIVLEVQYPDCVRSWVVPSVYVPVAVNCCGMPTGTLAVGGLMAIETSVAAVTVSTVEPEIVPEVALMVVVPIPVLMTNPVVLIVAVVMVLDAQVAFPVKFCVLPSVNVPAAVNCWVVPSAIEGFAGVTTSETSAAAVTVRDVLPVMPELEVAVMVVNPVPMA